MNKAGRKKSKPESWREVELGDIAVFHYGKSLTKQNRVDGDIPVFSSAGLVDFHNKALTDTAGIIIGRKGAAGKVYYSKTPFYCIDTAFYILPSDKYSLEFLFHLLLTLNLDELNEDSAVPGLNRDTAYQQKVFLPPLAEQKAIAEVLLSLDDKIDLLHRQNKILEDMAQTLFRQWFIEGEKADWAVGTLSDEFDVTMGQSPPGTSYNDEKQGMPLFQGNADFGFRFPRNRVWTTEPKRCAEKFDTLTSVRAPVGEQNMAIEKCCIGRGVATFQYKKNKNFRSYTYYKMKSLMRKIRQFNQEGTVFGSISKSDFENIEIVLPSFESIRDFQSITKLFDQKIVLNHSQIQRLEKLRDMLLPKLISGKVSVRP